MECRNRKRNRAWADLPPELLSSIAEPLTRDPISFRSFRSVCNSWRSSCTLSNHSLLSPHLPISVFNENCRLTTTVINVLRRPVTSSEGEFSWLTPTYWMSFLNEFAPGKVRVCKPLSQDPYSLPLVLPKTVTLSDFNVIELGRFYNVSSKKAVLLPNGLEAVALLDEGKLGRIRLDVGNSNWEIIHDGHDFQFDDIIEFKGRVLGIDCRGRIYDIGSDIKHIGYGLVLNEFFQRRKRLVESLGRLYLVVRFTRYKNIYDHNDEWEKPKCKVFELNEEMKKWVEITSLGDCSFFIGLDCSFSVSTQALGLSRDNCILFKKGSFPSYDGRIDEYFMFPSVFDPHISNDDYTRFGQFKSNDLNIGVYHLNDDTSYKTIESYWDYSDTLWPPPSWIWPIGRLKRLQEVETIINDKIVEILPPYFKTYTGWEKRVKRDRLPGEGGGIFSEDRQPLLLRWEHRFVGLTDGIDIQNLENAVNDLRRTEEYFPLLQEHTELRDTLIQLEKKELLMSTLTSSPVTEEERNCVEEMKSSIKRLRTTRDYLLCKIRVKYILMNAHVLFIEANAKALQFFYNPYSVSRR